jgi:hypothetical protein
MIDQRTGPVDAELLVKLRIFFSVSSCIILLLFSVFLPCLFLHELSRLWFHIGLLSCFFFFFFFFLVFWLAHCFDIFLYSFEFVRVLNVWLILTLVILESFEEDLCEEGSAAPVLLCSSSASTRLSSLL